MEIAKVIGNYVSAWKQSPPHSNQSMYYIHQCHRFLIEHCKVDDVLQGETHYWMKEKMIVAMSVSQPLLVFLNLA